MISVLSWLIYLAYKQSNTIQFNDFLNVRYILLFLISISITYLLVYFQRSRSMKLENTRLREENAWSELMALRNQMSPHFFFNTLNSLSAFGRSPRWLCRS